MVYLAVSRANPHINHNRLTINCTHISKYTSQPYCLSSAPNTTCYTEHPEGNGWTLPVSKLLTLFSNSGKLSPSVYNLIGCSLPNVLFSCIFIGLILIYSFFFLFLVWGAETERPSSIARKWWGSITLNNSPSQLLFAPKMATVNFSETSTSSTSLCYVIR